MNEYRGVKILLDEDVSYADKDFTVKSSEPRLIYRAWSKCGQVFMLNAQEALTEAKSQIDRALDGR